jgi:hypothetical protein
MVHDAQQRADRGNVEDASFLHLACCLGRDLCAVLDGVDPGAHTVFDPGPADGVGGDRRPPLVGLVDRGSDLLRGEGGEIHGHARREDAAGSHDLDGPGSGSKLVAHSCADAVGAVALPSEGVPSVPAGDGQGLPGGHHPRAGDATLFDGLAHLAGHRPQSTQVAHGGDARVDMPARIGHTLHRGEGLGHLCLGHEVG